MSPYDDYLLVADYGQQNVYQLIPVSGEVRAIPAHPCRPVSVSFDPTINGMYKTCVENKQYRISRQTFDGTIKAIIYYAPPSTFARMIGLLYNEAQQDAKVAQTTLTYILTVHKNEKKYQY